MVILDKDMDTFYILGSALDTAMSIISKKSRKRKLTTAMLDDMIYVSIEIRFNFDSKEKISINDVRNKLIKNSKDIILLEKNIKNIHLSKEILFGTYYKYNNIQAFKYIKCILSNRIKNNIIIF